MPTLLDGMFVSSTSLSFTWSSPPEEDRNGVIVGYIVTYYPVLAPANVTTEEVVGTSIVLSGLMIFTNYSVSVAAFTAVGTGPAASVIRPTDSSGECD